MLAAERARFGQPEINLGVFPPVAAYQLSRQIAPRKGTRAESSAASRSTPQPPNASVSSTQFSDAQFDSECEKWLERIYRQSASSLRFAKKAFRMAQSTDFDERLAAVERLYLEELMKTADANEGLNAFIEKRKPVWKNVDARVILSLERGSRRRSD